MHPLLPQLAFRGDRTPWQAESPALVFAVSRLASLAERVSLLEAGVDDYLAKPFDRRELLARVRALLRRHPLTLPGAGSGLVQVTDQWQLDLAGQRLVGGDQEVPLSAKEFQLLAHMVRHEGMVLSREALIASLWGPGYEGSTREIDVYVRYLRRKLEPEPKKPRYITTAWGTGYRYVGVATGRRKAAGKSQRAPGLLGGLPHHLVLVVVLERQQVACFFETPSAVSHN